MDEQAAELARLYRELGPAVWAYAARQLRSRHEADEVLQETFLIVARDFSRLTAASSQRAWLIGIARNVLRHQRKSRWWRRRRELTGDPVAAPEAPHDSRISAMRAAIQRLPDSQREVLELRIVNELSYAEIAEALDIPIGTVRSRLHGAVTSLRDWADAVDTERILETGA